MARQDATEAHTDKVLTEGERDVALLRMKGLTVREIQKRAGMHYSTAAEILRRPHVAEFIETCRRDTQEAVRQRIVNGGGLAVRTLLKVMRDPTAPHAAKVAAARTLLPATTVIEGGDADRPVRVSVDLRTASTAELEAIAAEDVPTP
jgi:hypothetical protein